MQGKRLKAAKAATAAAIDCLPDGVRFAVVAGTGHAELVHPAQPPLAISTGPARQLAKEALRGLRARGGTTMSTWIALTTELVRHEPGLHHAILLTDGKNEGDTSDQLDQALAEAEGVFQCDCRGVGGDWEVSELRQVATALLGSYDMVHDPGGLRADFESMLQGSLDKQLGAVTLQIRTPQGGGVTLLKQLDPDNDLTGKRTEVDQLVGDYPTGAWGDETREYHLCVRVPLGTVGEPAIRAAGVSLMVDGEKVGQVRVMAAWTDDLQRSTVKNRKVAEVLGEAEIDDLARQGMDALRDGDLDTATDRIVRARDKAVAAGNAEFADTLSKLVNPASGRVRALPDIDPRDANEAELPSGRTKRTGPRAAPEPHHPDQPREEQGAAGT